MATAGPHRRPGAKALCCPGRGTGSGIRRTTTGHQCPHTDRLAARVAAANALWHRVSVIAVGPGTGKTHTVTRVLALLLASGLAAPLAPNRHPTGTGTAPL
ncbi:hypothetical protein CKO15_08020 [Halorhodospira abdelmalekii]|nr:hypothetical protein [Halorhodospira abdelmalekii]